MHNAFENDEDIDNYNRVIAHNQLAQYPSAVVKGMVKSRRGWGGIVPGDVMVKAVMEKETYPTLKDRVTMEFPAMLLSLGWKGNNK